MASTGIRWSGFGLAAVAAVVSLVVWAVTPAWAAESAPRSELRRIDSMLYSGQFAEAEAELRQALAQSGASVELLLRLGNTLSLQEEYEKSEAVFQQALALEPAEPRILHNLGMMFLRQKRYDEALEYFHQTLAVRSWHPHTNFYIGVIHERRGDVEEALRSYIEELNVNPASASAWRRYVLLQRGDRASRTQEFPWPMVAIWLAVVLFSVALYWLKKSYWDLPESPGFSPDLQE